VLSRSLLASALAAVLLAVPAAAQQFQVAGRAATITVGGRMHFQYAVSSIDGADNDFMMRRARPNLDLTISDFLAARVETEFAGGSILRDAWLRFGFSDGFMLSVGQFKRGFDIFTLASSVDLSLIERDGRVEGVDVCTGVGSVCTYGRFMEELDYADRDMGVRVEGASGSVSYLVTFTNGTGTNSADENDAKSLAGRLVFAVNDDMRLGGGISVHDYVDPNGNEMAVAFAGDVEVGTWRDGLHVQGGIVVGDNWLELGPTLDPATLLAFQGALSYYYPMDGDRFVGLEPIARLSWADPDTDTDDDGGMLITPGLMFYMSGRTKIGLNVDVYAPQTGDTEYSFKAQTFLYF
jgi:hypothetical protein